MGAAFGVHDKGEIVLLLLLSLLLLLLLSWRGLRRNRHHGG